MAILSTGQITIVDLTDERQISLYLNANQPKNQVRTGTKNAQGVTSYTYSPNINNTNSLTISPTLLFGNSEDTEQIQYVKYYIESEPVSEESTFGAYVSNNRLIITKNLGQDATGLFNNDHLVIYAKIPANRITDSKTGLQNSSEIVATFEWTRIDNGISGIDGAAGISVKGVTQLYLSKAPNSDGSLTPPLAPNDETGSNLGGWSSTVPGWDPDEYLWLCTQIAYSNGKYSYTTPYTDPAWRTAKETTALLQDKIVDLQRQVDGVVDTWYRETSPEDNGFINPWFEGMNPGELTDDEKSRLNREHVGDLFLNLLSNRAWRFTEQFTWVDVTGTPDTLLLNQINNLQTQVDGKVTMHYGPTENVSNPQDGDLCIGDDGNFYLYTSKGDGTFGWVPQSIAARKMEVQFAKSTNPAVEPTSGWNATTPTWEEGVYIWQRIAYWTDQDPGENDPPTQTSKAVCISAAAAKNIKIIGEQVFTSTTGTFSGTKTLRAELSGGLTIKHWAFKSSREGAVGGEEIVKVINGNGEEVPATGTTLEIAADHVAFGAYGEPNQAVFYVYSNEGSYYDTCSMYKVSDGQSATTVFAGNENFTLAADATGQIMAQTITIPIIAYRGSTRMGATISKSNIMLGSLAPYVTSYGVSGSGTTSATVTLSIPASNLGSADNQSGEIVVKVGSPAATLVVSWSKIKEGKQGAQGSPAIFAEISATRKHFSDLQTDDIALTGQIYSGGSTVTSTQNTWTIIPELTEAGEAAFKTLYPSISISTTNSVTTLSGLTSNTLSIPREAVEGAATYTYTGKYQAKTYSAQTVIEDKTDPLQVSIYSTAGDKFTNGNTATRLICKVYNSQGEVDPYDSSYNAAASPYVYTWTKYILKDGVITQDITNFGTKTGKYIDISNKEISIKAIFDCTVTEKTAAQEG